jgi:hypothetical protein
LCDAQRDVAATDEQHPLHHVAGRQRVPAIHPRACACGGSARERCISNEELR